MDVETELSKESDLSETKKIEEIKKPVEVERIERSKDRKSNVKPKRTSRSRTPQKKIEEPKISQVSLKKVEEEVNGHEENTIQEKQLDEKCEDQKIEHKLEQHLEANQNGPVPKQNENNLDNGRLKEETENQTENDISETNESAKKNGEEKQTEEITDKDKGVQEKAESSKKDSKQETLTSEPETVEMEPLVVGDEVESELQFLEENSDRDSGKGSPVIPRCVTRRSYTRNIPTPKTPKLAEDPDLEKNSVVDQVEENICNLPNDIPKTELNETRDSLDIANVSTEVEVGSDTTRVKFAEVDDSPSDMPPLDESYLKKLRERVVSARRPLHATEDYRTRVLRNAQNRSDLNFSYDSIEKVNTGVKRKNRSMTPEDNKKFRSESPGYTNFFTSPITNLRNKFKSDQRSSTPELLGYKDEKKNIHFNEDLDDPQIQGTGDDEKKNWCSIM